MYCRKERENPISSNCRSKSTRLLACFRCLGRIEICTKLVYDDNVQKYKMTEIVVLPDSIFCKRIRRNLMFIRIS